MYEDPEICEAYTIPAALLYGHVQMTACGRLLELATNIAN